MLLWKTSVIVISLLVKFAITSVVVLVIVVRFYCHYMRHCSRLLALLLLCFLSSLIS